MAIKRLAVEDVPEHGGLVLVRLEIRATWRKSGGAEVGKRESAKESVRRCVVNANLRFRCDDHNPSPVIAELGALARRRLVLRLRLAVSERWAVPNGVTFRSPDFDRRKNTPTIL